MLIDLTAYKYSGNIKKDCIDLLRQAGYQRVLNHTQAVVAMGKFIAKHENIDIVALQTACYLHDISVLIPRGKYEGYCIDNGIEVLEVERKLPILLHQKVSANLARSIFKISNRKIIDSINCHTTLKENATDLDMILFISDKLAWDLDGIPPYKNKVMEALSKSLKNACKTYIDYALENNMILYPHPDLIKALSWLNSDENY